MPSRRIPALKQFFCAGNGCWKTTELCHSSVLTTFCSAVTRYFNINTTGIKNRKSSVGVACTPVKKLVQNGHFIPSGYRWSPFGVACLSLDFFILFTHSTCSQSHGMEVGTQLWNESIHIIMEQQQSWTPPQEKQSNKWKYAFATMLAATLTETLKMD